MGKRCARCDEPFEATSARARFCSDRCRKAASRATGRTAPVTDTPDVRPPVPDTIPDAAADIRTLVVDATVRELEAANRLDSALGAAALLAAARLASSGPLETGNAFAALVREHRAALAAALVDAESAADPLDSLRGAVLKVIQGGAA